MEVHRDASIVVVGLGSPIMTDDAIGLKVSEEIEKMHLDDVDCCQEAIGGLDILPVIHGYRHAIIVDAIQSYQFEPGTVVIYDPEDFESTVADASAHDVNLATALKIGRQMDDTLMPETVKFVAVEVEDLATMSETMTPKVQAALGSAVDATLHLIGLCR